MKFFNKNKIYSIIGICVLFANTFGCQDFLEENPESLLSPVNFPQTAEDADLVLGGISAALLSSKFGNRALILTAEVSSDETVTRYTSGNRYSLDHFEYVTSNLYIRDTYNSCYLIINQANLLLKSLPDESWSKPYKAAAKFYRAWMYSYLVRLYGASIIRETPTEVIDPNEAVVRASEVDVYNFIIKDLEEAEDDLPINWTQNDFRDDGRPTKGAGKILLAKMYISMAGWPVNDDSKWSLALAKVQEVIDLGVYELANSFSDLFLIENKNESESILSIQMPEVAGMLSVQSRPTGGGIKVGGWSLWKASADLMNAFNDNDDRKSGSFMTEVIQAPNATIPFTKFSYNRSYEPTPAIQKYQDFGRENINENAKRSSLGLPIFRFAEAYLIKAEAENEINGPTEKAIEAVNVLRRRANADEISSEVSQEELRGVIHQEWSYEFAFEIKRRFNLLRWGIMDDVLGSDPRASKGYAPYKKYFPIPQAEFDSGLDPDLQNPGY